MWSHEALTAFRRALDVLVGPPAQTKGDLIYSLQLPGAATQPHDAQGECACTQMRVAQPQPYAFSPTRPGSGLLN